MTDTQYQPNEKYKDSPYKPLWKKKTQTGRDKYVGVVNLDGQEYWLNLFPNTYKKSEKAPDFTFTLEKKES
jgi:hypothetical protein